GEIQDQSGGAGTSGIIDEARGVLAIGVVGYDINAYAVNVTAVCQRTWETFMQWKLQTFEKIQTAYNAALTAYNQKLTQAAADAGITISGQHPATNQSIMRTELKKSALIMLTGKHFGYSTA